MILPIVVRSFFLRCTLAVGAAVSLVSFACAAGAPPGSNSYVVYSPGTVQSMQGDAPFTNSYQLSVTSPSATPVGNYTVSLSASVLVAPAGSDPVAAAGYLSFAPVLTFTGPNQTQVVTVSLNVPAGAVAGNFSYLINTSGWPTGFSIVDLGTTINMTVLSSGTFPGPTVAISSPLANTTFGRLPGSGPVAVPISIDAGATESATLLSLVATVSGVANDGTIIPSVPLILTITGLGSANASSHATYSAVLAGTYTVTAVSTNSQGQATATTTFIVQDGQPPTVTITVPPAANYDYYLGAAPLSVPFTFVGQSFANGITSLSATIDGDSVVITPQDLGALFATGTGTLGTYSTAGTHLLVVTAQDIFGTATTSTSFTVTVIRPTPTIVINEPVNGTVLTLASGATTMDVPFTFTTSTSPNFTVSSLSASLNGATLALPSQIGLGTVQAVGSGTMSGLPAGTYTLNASGISAGIQVQTSVTFTINKPIVIATPPTVVINTPPAGSTYTLGTGCGSVLSIPLTFTGSSTTPGAVITKLTATLDGTSLSVSSSNLNQKNSQGSATMSIRTTGVHTIVVTATDANGTATATRTFSVTVPNAPQKVSGLVFFDANLDGIRQSDDYGLDGVSVKLVNASGQTVASTTTASDGTYVFTVAPGTYSVLVGQVNGMSLTTLHDNGIVVAGTPVSVLDTGYGLYFASLRCMNANGFTIGYWKNNVDKAIAGRSAGIQVSGTAIKAYTSAIGNLALAPFTGLTMSGASSIMGSTSSAPSDLLAKQLVASEYNYANGAFIGGDRRLTYAFIYYAEYVLKNASSYSGTYIIWVKDWCDAYNNSHGGAVAGPTP
jgi:hypothetical protein